MAAADLETYSTITYIYPPSAGFVSDFKDRSNNMIDQHSAKDSFHSCIDIFTKLYGK